MSDTPKDVVFLTDHMFGKGPYICLWSEDQDLVERFRQIAYLTLPNSLGWFHQGSGTTYHMFEFWKPNTTKMEGEAKRIATELGLPCQINLTQKY